MSEDDLGVHERWARLRFAIIGPLLAAPPPAGELRAALVALSSKHWRHPVTGEAVRFGFSTLERWYYAALEANSDPVAALRPRRRADAGRYRRMSSAFRRVLHAQYEAHRRWSVQLHYDNLAVRLEHAPELGPLPSYATVRRYFRAQGLRRQRRGRNTPGAAAAEHRLDSREVRSYEVAHVCALWHADFHVASRAVLTERGQWAGAHLLGVLDDHSRLCCHAQWYPTEATQTFVHGLTQALQKRGLPRALLTDNGGAETAAEVREGLARLGIVHETTLPYSAYQNAKQEVFWNNVEGRLLPMLDTVAALTLEKLNEATLPWVEMEYNRRVHSELGCTPLERFLDGADVARECPGAQALRRAFCARTTRAQRRSDGTCTLEGVRFEIPSRYRHLARLVLRYARWDLSAVELVDPNTEQGVATLYPLDKTRNAEAARRRLEPIAERPVPLPTEAGPAEMAPLLKELIAEYAATGLPPAYLPFNREEPDP